MIGKYLQQSFMMLKQQPLFSCFYIVATGLAISMVMVLAVLYYIKIGGISILRPIVAVCLLHLQLICNIQKIRTGNTTWKIFAHPLFVKGLLFTLWREWKL